MRRRDVRQRLLAVAAPDELGAQRRAWTVVRTAFAEREQLPRPRRRVRPLLALAAGLAALAAAVSPPGQAVLDSLRDAIGRSERLAPARPALFALPSEGRLLVNARRAWVVNADGSRRALDGYRDASWSPRGLHVVARRQHELAALDPREKGAVKWALSRPNVSRPRWSTGLGYRVAYLSGRSLRVVAGDGKDDRPLDAPVDLVAPAWKPGKAVEHVLAYGKRGRVVVRQTDTRKLLWRSREVGALRQLLWSADGRRLLAVGARSLLLFRADGRVLGARKTGSRFPRFAWAAFAPSGRRIALVQAMPGSRSELVLLDGRRGALARRGGRMVFAGPGVFTGVEWSPDGRWLVLQWKSADEWLFIPANGRGKIEPYTQMSRQFDPGGEAPIFPTVAQGGWCCRGAG